MTREELKSFSPCAEGFAYWCKNCEGKEKTEQIRTLLSHRFDWANWLIVRMMTHEHKVKYAIFAAEQVIKIYEDRYPNDCRPRKAIEAAKEYLQSKNKKAADAAAAAAYAAADAAYAAAADAADAAAAAAADAADAAADAAYAATAAAYAAYDAYDAAYAANAAATAAAYAATAADAANAAAYAAYDANALKKSIIEYGIELIKGTCA